MLTKHMEKKKVENVTLMTPVQTEVASTRCEKQRYYQHNMQSKIKNINKRAAQTGSGVSL